MRAARRSTPEGPGGRAQDLPATSRRALFARSCVPDFLLVLLASTALVFTVSYAFESAPDLRANIGLCAGLAAPMLVILFAGSWSKRAVVPAAVLAVAYAAAVLAVLAQGLPEGVGLFVDGQVNDVPENPLVFGLVALVVPVVVYVLSRRRALVVALLAATVVACGAVQFLYRDWATANPGTVASLVALFAVLGQFVFQGYRSAIYGAKRVNRTSFGGAFAFSALIAGACLALACTVFYGLIAPLGLQTPEIKPFKDYYARPVVEYSGVYQRVEVDDPDLATDELNDEENESNQDAEGGEDDQSPDDTQDWGANPISPLVRQLSSFSLSSWIQGLQAISYQQLAVRSLLAVLAVLAACGLVVGAQRLRRWARLRRTEGRDPAWRVWYLYRFVTGRLERLGIKRPASFTPLEFALAQRQDMLPFTRNTGGVDYLDLTLAYQRACYAPETVTDDDVKAAEGYYRAFFDNARAFVGNRRWLYHFWRI